MIYAYWTPRARDAARRPDGLHPARRRHPDRRAARPTSRVHAVLRPGVPRAGVRAVRRARRRRATTSAASSTTASRSARTDWISDGTLTALLQTRHSAGLTGQPVTPAIDNLVARGRRRPPAASTTWSPAIERGLLLTCLWYIREVDPQTLLLTGLTRDGVYLVEDGEAPLATR